MPAVRKGEKESDYVPRCVKYVIDNEGLDQKAALGKCYGMYKQHQKNQKKTKGEKIIEALAEQLKQNAK